MDNVLFGGEAACGGIAAVLDWELSTLGDGLADLAYVSRSHSGIFLPAPHLWVLFSFINFVLTPKLCHVCFPQMCLSYQFSPNNGFMKGLRGLDLEEIGIPSLEETVSLYSQLTAHHSGRAAVPPANLLRDMDFYMAFSLFRCCSILQGVYKRYAHCCCVLPLLLVFY